METSKQGFVRASACSNLVSAKKEDVMGATQTPFQTVYFHTLSGLPLYAHAQPPTSQDTASFPLSVPQPSPKPALSLLTLHVSGGMQLQQPGQRAGVTPLTTRSKSVGKHVCVYCGRDCLKPSVLEKHLRCHTGERPYPCNTCGVAFKTQSNLYKHKRTQAHARLSSDSERDSLSSQESVQGSRETSWSNCSLEVHSEGSGSFEKDVPTPQTSPSAVISSPEVSCAQGQVGPDTGWALRKAAVVGLILTPMNGNQEALSSLVQNTDRSPAPAQKHHKAEEGGRPVLLTANRHLSLQRQEATFFSKQWDSRASGGKSQNHDSTDSGFSESPSPGSALHDHSMESLAESGTEDLEEGRTPEAPPDAMTGACRAPKSKVSLLEKRKLEERIARLISENDALVDDKRLENVRPRKTVPSKQGSIDVPVPYTYKDSFHFEMKTSRQTIPISDWQKSEKQLKQALYSSVPTQQSVSLEHTPLVRSSSLPFNIGSSGINRMSLYSSYQRESTQLTERDRTGHAHSGDLLMKSMDQPASHHRCLVRQKAVDCFSSSECLSLTSPMEGRCVGVATEGESVDLASESSGGKCRRKKMPKFPYNKWYMYGDGTFRKLYNMEKGSERNAFRMKKSGTSTEQGKVQEVQNNKTVLIRQPGSSDLKPDTSTTDSACISTRLSAHPPPSGCSSIEQVPSSPDASSGFQKPVFKDLTVSTELLVNKEGGIKASNNKNEGAVKEADPTEQHADHPSPPPHSENHVPSERKKQKTDDSIHVMERTSTTEGVNVMSCAAGLVRNDTTLRQNQQIPPFRTHGAQKHVNNVEEKSTDKSQAKKVCFSICSTEQQQEKRMHGSSSPQQSDGKTSVSTKSSFLPKYQLKLPQLTNSITAASCLPLGVADRHPLTPAQVILEGQTDAPDCALVDRHTDTSQVSASKQRPLSTADKSSSGLTESVEAVPSNYSHSSISSPIHELSTSCQTSQYKGKLTLLNSSTTATAEDTGHVREKTGDIHIFLQIVSGEQLPVSESQHDSKQGASSGKDTPHEEPKTAKPVVENLGAAQKAQDIQPSLLIAQETTVKVTPSSDTTSKASTAQMFGVSSDRGNIFQTKQHSNSEEPPQTSSLYSNLIVIPTQLCSNQTALTDSIKECQCLRTKKCEASSVDQEHHIQKQRGSARSSGVPSEKAPLVVFQETVGPTRGAALGLRAPDKPVEKLTDIQMAGKQTEELPLFLLISTPAPASVSGNQSDTLHSPYSPKPSRVPTHQPPHSKTSEHTLTSSEVSGSSGHSCASTATKGQVQNTVDTVVTPSQITSSIHLSLSQCQQQKSFTCEIQHPSPSRHSMPCTNIPFEEIPKSKYIAPAICKEVTSVEKRMISTESLNSGLLLSPDIPDHSDPATTVTASNNAAQCNLEPQQCNDTGLSLICKTQTPPENHADDARKAGPSTADLSDDSGFSISVEKPVLSLHHQIQMNSLCVRMKEAADLQIRASTSVNDFAEESGTIDKEAQNITSSSVSEKTSQQASTATLTVNQQRMGSRMAQDQLKVTPAPNTLFSPLASTGISSQSLRVHTGGQHKLQSQGVQVSVKELNGETVNCVNSAADVHQSQPTLSGQTHNRSKTNSAGITQNRETSEPPQVESQTFNAQRAHVTGGPLRTREPATLKDQQKDTSHKIGETGQAEKTLNVCISSPACMLQNESDDEMSVHGREDICAVSHVPATGHVHGVSSSSVPPAAERGLRSCVEPNEQRKLLEGNKEGEKRSRGMEGCDISPFSVKRGGILTDTVGAERLTARGQAKSTITHACRSVSPQPSVAPVPRIPHVFMQDGANMANHLQPALHNTTKEGDSVPPSNQEETSMQDHQPSVQSGDAVLAHSLHESLQSDGLLSQSPCDSLRSENALLHTLHDSVQSDSSWSQSLHDSLQSESVLSQSLCDSLQSESPLSNTFHSETLWIQAFQLPFQSETGSPCPPRSESSRLDPLMAPIKKGAKVLKAIQPSIQGQTPCQETLGKVQRGQQNTFNLAGDVPAITDNLLTPIQHPFSMTSAQPEGKERSGSCSSTTGRASPPLLNQQSDPSLDAGLCHGAEQRVTVDNGPKKLSGRPAQSIDPTSNRPEVTASVSTSWSHPLRCSQTSPLPFPTPPHGSTRSQGGAEEASFRVGTSDQGEGTDSCSSDDEGKLVIEL